MLEDFPVPASPNSRQLLAFFVYKSLGIVYQFFLGKLVTYQIIQFHMGNVQNRNDMYTLLVMGNAEGLVQAEFADTVFSYRTGSV